LTRVTISDVAKAAGVSMKSVSRVINREPNVSEALRQRVEVAIDALGYVPEPAARSLAGGRAFAIGILFDNPSPHYTMKIQAGAYAACRRNGFHLLIENLNSGGEDIIRQMEEVLRNSRVDGVILTPPISDNAIVMDMLEARQIPYVRIAPVSFAGRTHAFAMDDHAAAITVARYLWDLGHRRFGFVQGAKAHGDAQLRRSGFLETVADLGGAAVAEAYGGFVFEGGITAGQELLSLPERPTAIFAANDDSAAGLMSTIAAAGLKVPDDISVVGFDNSWVALSVWPYLTTIHQPVFEMAEAAALKLIDRNVGSGETTTQLFDYALVVRESAAPPESGQ
jgi:LacI family transcriptional regulator